MNRRSELAHEKRLKSIGSLWYLVSYRKMQMSTGSNKSGSHNLCSLLIISRRGRDSVLEARCSTCEVKYFIFVR